MTDIELLENMYKICEMLLANAAKSFGIDFAILNKTMMEIEKRKEHINITIEAKGNAR